MSPTNFYNVIETIFISYVFDQALVLHSQLPQLLFYIDLIGKTKFIQSCLLLDQAPQNVTRTTTIQKYFAKSKKNQAKLSKTRKS